MDKAPLQYSASLATESKALNKVVNPASNDYAALGFDYSAGGNSYFSRGNKRKWGKDNGSSLVLGLGPSSSSGTTISSGKEMEEESSIDLGLRIDPFLGHNRIGNPKKASYISAKALEVKRPNVDLELSLSTGPAESDITNVGQGSSPHQNTVEAPALVAGLHLVDEGSTSSRWKCGPLVPPLPSLVTVIPVDQVPDLNSPISVTPNIFASPVVTPKSFVACNSGPVSQQRRTNVKTCQYEGCIRGARGASGLCIAHGGGRRCQRAGCQKGAEGKTVFCKAHGGGRRCQHLGCTKSAEGRTDYCIGHGGGKRCSHEGCTRAARGKSGLCIRHGGGKRCKIENCTKSAEGISSLCISHGGGRRCEHPTCSKGAQGSTMFCKAHGGGKRCTYLGCTKGAEGSTPFCKGHGGGKRCIHDGCTKSVHGGTLFCVSHGGGKRCATPGCTKSARGRTNFCVRHGGGKRCKTEGCTKSAQGSTDFCKAHGGGKRCSWGQMGSEFAGQAALPCDKFARGKSGLCASHASQVQEKSNYGGVSSNSPHQEMQSSAVVDKMKGILDLASGIITSDGGGMPIGFWNCGHLQTTVHIPPQGNSLVGSAHLDQFSLPEGRVHGGSLMAMLRGSRPSHTSNSSFGGQEEPGKSCTMSHG